MIVSWILDNFPWWGWALIVGGILAATYPLWSTFWAILPITWRIVLLGIGAAILFYFAGRNSGAAGALSRAREQEKRRVDEINRKGAEARAASERKSDSGKLRDTDRWERPDG